MWIPIGWRRVRGWDAVATRSTCSPANAACSVESRAPDSTEWPLPWATNRHIACTTSRLWKIGPLATRAAIALASSPVSGLSLLAIASSYEGNSMMVR